MNLPNTVAFVRTTVQTFRFYVFSNYSLFFRGKKNVRFFNTANLSRLWTRRRNDNRAEYETRPSIRGVERLGFPARRVHILGPTVNAVP